MFSKTQIHILWKLIFRKTRSDKNGIATLDNVDYYCHNGIRYGHIKFCTNFGKTTDMAKDGLACSKVCSIQSSIWVIFNYD